MHSQGKPSSNKTLSLRKSINRDIWEIDTLNQLFFSTIYRLKKKTKTTTKLYATKNKVEEYTEHTPRDAPLK